ncbi:MAG: GTPase ObgE [bacterium]|nr:GTPase ObgE [bacterium]
MIIDEVKIKISAGKGGDGMVAFDRSKFSQGPSGSKGGDGGSVYLEGVSNLNALSQFRFTKDFAAKDGEGGKSRRLDGARGEELVLKAPVGTIAHNLTTGKDMEVVEVGQRLLLARGGKGGRGNWYFRSSTNVTPKEFERGTLGENFDIVLELQLIADVGLIGLPNAGKSSLINLLTRAGSKVAPYAFTTLEPVLGAFFDIVIADIPGLIEGAAAGKGLGIKFLRHIKRTKVLFHCISSESENLTRDYKTIREELQKYDSDLAKKQEYVLLTKTDLVDAKEVTKKIKELKKVNPEVHPLSIYDEKSIEKIKNLLSKIKIQK